MPLQGLSSLLKVNSTSQFTIISEVAEVAFNSCIQNLKNICSICVCVLIGFVSVLTFNILIYLCQLTQATAYFNNNCSFTPSELLNTSLYPWMSCEGSFASNTTGGDDFILLTHRRLFQVKGNMKEYVLNLIPSISSPMLVSLLLFYICLPSQGQGEICA